MSGRRPKVTVLLSDRLSGDPEAIGAVIQQAANAAPDHNIEIKPAPSAARTRPGGLSGSPSADPERNKIVEAKAVAKADQVLADERASVERAGGDADARNPADAKTRVERRSVLRRLIAACGVVLGASLRREVGERADGFVDAAADAVLSEDDPAETNAGDTAGD